MGQKISELPIASTLGGEEIIPLVQEGQTRRATVEQIRGETTQLLGRRVTLVNNTAVVAMPQLAATLSVEGALTGAGTLTLPDAARGTFTIDNRTSGSFPLTVKTSMGSVAIAAQGYQTIVTVNGDGVKTLMLGSVGLFDTPFWRGGDEGELTSHTTPRFTVNSNAPEDGGNGFGHHLTIEGMSVLKLKPHDTIELDGRLSFPRGATFTGDAEVLYGQFRVISPGNTTEMLKVQPNGHVFLRPNDSTKSVIVEPTPNSVTPHSTLQSGGSIALGSNTTHTQAVTLNASHYALYFDTSGGDITQHLPLASGLDGREYVFTKTTADTNTLTIVAPVQGIDEAVVLRTRGENVTYRACDGIWQRKGTMAHSGVLDVIIIDNSATVTEDDLSEKTKLVLHGTLTQMGSVTLPESARQSLDVVNATVGGYSVRLETGPDSNKVIVVKSGLVTVNAIGVQGLFLYEDNITTMCIPRLNGGGGLRIGAFQPDGTLYNYQLAFDTGYNPVVPALRSLGDSASNRFLNSQPNPTFLTNTSSQPVVIGDDATSETKANIELARDVVLRDGKSLQTNGGLTLGKNRNITASTTLADDDYAVYCDTTNGVIVLMLPVTQNLKVGREYLIVKSSDDTNSVLINTPHPSYGGGIYLSSRYQCTRVRWSGARWFEEAGNALTGLILNPAGNPSANNNGSYSLATLESYGTTALFFIPQYNSGKKIYFGHPSSHLERINFSFTDKIENLPNMAVGTEYPHSKVQSVGSVALGSNTASSNVVTLNENHYTIYYNTSSGSITQPLPSPSGIDGREYVFFKATDDGNTVDFSVGHPSLWATGYGSPRLVSKGECVVLKAFNGAWYATTASRRAASSFTITSAGDGATNYAFSVGPDLFDNTQNGFYLLPSSTGTRNFFIGSPSNPINFFDLYGTSRVTNAPDIVLRPTKAIWAQSSNNGGDSRAFFRDSADNMGWRNEGLYGNAYYGVYRPDSSGWAYIQTRGIERVIVTDSGKVGIGTNSPHSSFHAKGSVALGNDSVAYNAITLTDNHYAVYFDTTSGSIEQVLPSPDGLDGRTYMFFKASGDGNPLIIHSGGAGKNTTLHNQDDCVTYRAFAGWWRRVALITSPEI